MGQGQSSTEKPQLAGRTVIVTGGGSGIGAATARLAARRGAAVGVADIDRASAEEVRDEIVAVGGTAAALSVDVSQEADVARMIADTAEALGPVTGLVNNAGVIVTRALVDTPVEEWDRCLQVNARGAFLGCKHLVRHAREHGLGAAIVNTGSISALAGQDGQAAYAASKGAIVQLTRQIAGEHAAEGIRCNSVGPGSIRSAVLDSFLGSQEDPAAAEQTLAATHPVGRIGDPEEVAAAMCFLLADEASFITGANLQVDGGYTAV